jgi:hypothetical protein
VLSGHLPFNRDARAFAAKIESLELGPVHEVVFIDTQPYLGLTFYLDVEVEELALEKDERRQSVAEEIREPPGEEPRLWVVPDTKSETFLALCAENEYPVRHLGDMRAKIGYRLYGTERRDPAHAGAGE